MLHIDLDYQNWLDYLIINGDSPDAVKHMSWSKEECTQIISAHEYLEKCQPYIDNEFTIDESFRKVDRWTIPNNAKHSWIYEKICQTIVHANRDFWNFDIDLIETIELLNYSFDENDSLPARYDKHSDFGGNYTARKLSYVALLSDPGEFDGGDLILSLRTDVPMIKNQGQVIIFPSFVFHEVSPITKGSRWSLVTWIRGRSFR
jgi:PKHD-type hydroxylase